MTFQTAYGNHKRVTVPVTKKLPKGDVKGAKQEFKDDCDINKIIARLVKTEAIDHFAEHGLRYGDFVGPQYDEAMNIVAEAESMFHDLPGHIRQEFKNVTEFCEYATDEANAEQMAEWGLVDSPEVENLRAAAATSADAQNEATATTEAEEDSTVVT